MRVIKVDSTYKHFKGHIYKVIAIGYDSEKYDENNPDASRVVVYQNVDTNEVWVRPYEMFNSLVDQEKYPGLLQKYRFEEIESRSK